MTMNELTQYLKENYNKSIFDRMEKDGEVWTLHLYGNRVVSGQVKTNKKYDIIFQPETGKEEEIPKHDIKFLCLKDYEEVLKKRIRTDKKIREKKLEPIINPKKRYHIKNKTLFPLMKDKTLLFFTTLEGDVCGGIIGGFTRYEILLLGKKGIPMTLLRHAVYDARDKRKKCYLKKAVEARFKTSRPGKKSSSI